MTLCIRFNDSPAVRAALRLLAAHAQEDGQTFFEEQSEDAEETGMVPAGVTAAEMADAYGEVAAAIDLAVLPII